MSITIVFATKGVWSTETGLNKAAADSRMYDREMIDTLESAFRFTPPGTAMTEPYMRAINQRIAARGAKPCTLDLFRTRRREKVSFFVLLAFWVCILYPIFLRSDLAGRLL